MNLVVVPSIIKPPNSPLSYIETRSIYNSIERFEHTKKTIESIREKIPNSKILLVECSELTNEEMNYFNHHCDYVINLIHDKQSKENIYSSSKSLGEGTMTIKAIEYIEQNNIIFNQFFKLSGRYWLSDSFDYSKFNNNNIIIKPLDNDDISTVLYKLPFNIVGLLKLFLYDHRYLMEQCIGYENIFGIFILSLYSYKIDKLSIIGTAGYVSVCNHFIDY